MKSYLLIFLVLMLSNSVLAEGAQTFRVHGRLKYCSIWDENATGDCYKPKRITGGALNFYRVNRKGNIIGKPIARKVAVNYYGYFKTRLPLGRYVLSNDMSCKNPGEAICVEAEFCQCGDWEFIDDINVTPLTPNNPLTIRIYEQRSV